MTTPLVTCLCLTRDRPDFLRRAIQCFNHQTYANRELLIIGGLADIVNVQPIENGETPAQTTSYCDPPVALMVVGGQLNIGRKRNVGCESAQGDLIAIWDDDDYSAPGRLEFQVNSMAVSRKSVTGFQLMKFTDRTSWWQFALPHGLVHGASLCFTRDWWKANPFPEVNIGEDAAFCEAAAAAGQLAQCPDMDLMYASIHAGNTSKKNVLQPGWLALPGYQWKE